MCRIFTGFLAGFITGLCVAEIIPIEYILAASVIFMLLAALLLVLFHLGLRDFQEY